MLLLHVYVPLQFCGTVVVVVVVDVDVVVAVVVVVVVVCKLAVGKRTAGRSHVHKGLAQAKP